MGSLLHVLLPAGTAVQLRVRMRVGLLYEDTYIVGCLMPADAAVQCGSECFSL
jgi:hypothetical protein